ncbi:MAG: peptide MFS transporter [Candidatus Saccharibacteria bacterium]|nr:peptide MFS transporter [Moraxellaceae bacterium]
MVMTSPDRSFLGHPRALAPLFATELWERFSYYGIRPLLILFMTATLSTGGYGFDRQTAAAIVGMFAGSVYLAALPGGWLADRVIGQARAMWWGSVLIGLGHLSIALSMSLGKPAFFAGLGLIVLGTGLFKTCASVMVGRLYTDDDPRRDGGYSIFYMGINLGAFVAPLITGLLSERLGWAWGFGAGGVGMLIALLIYRFTAKATFDRLANDLPPVSRQTIVKILAGLLLVVVAVIGLINLYSAVVLASSMTYVLATAVLVYIAWLLGFGGLNTAEKKRVLLCLLVFVAGTVFWSANEQQPTALNLFAQDFTDKNIGGFTIPVLWFQSINPISIIIFAPIFGVLWRYWPSRELSASLGKFALGMLICAVAFGLMYLASNQVLAGTAQVSPLWLIAAYVLSAIAELCISPIALAAMTLVAPRHLQGQMMGLWFMSVSLGNLIAGITGGNVNPENLADMPALFGRTTLSLIIVAVVLLALAPIMKRWVR